MEQSPTGRLQTSNNNGKLSLRAGPVPGLRRRRRIAATAGAIPDSVRTALLGRGFEFAPCSPDDQASLSVKQTGARVVLIDAGALPQQAKAARRILEAAREGGVVPIVVGDIEPSLAEVAAETAHACVPSATDIPSLLSAIRSALEGAALRDELGRAKEFATLKDAEARALYEIGTALSAERDLNRLQELILQRCREITSADAGSLYLLDENPENKQKILRFEVAQNDSVPSSYSRFTMPLTDRSIAGYVALSGETLNLADVYQLPPDAPYGFNRAFDERMGYRTKSMLVVPLRNHEGDVVGVIQLINRKRAANAALVTPDIVEREVVAFPSQAGTILDSFAGQAAVALDNRLLIENIQQLFEGFVRASITAIEARDPTTSGHSERVAELTVGIATAVTEIGVGHWRDVRFNLDQIREIRYAGLLHDFGKIGVREHVLVKAKKLYDWQLELIRMRFALMMRSRETEYALQQLDLIMEQGRDALVEASPALESDYRRTLQSLQDELSIVTQANEPSVLDQDVASRLRDIASRSYRTVDDTDHPLLDESELLALSVKRGSLTEDERVEIESHVSHTYRFLSLMPWTRQLKQVPLIAGAHHEKLDGSGYPNRLSSDEIPTQSKMMAIADIYDALTASDRPYKRAVPVEKALDILWLEAKANHVDSGLLDIFIQRKVYDLTAGSRSGEHSAVITR